MRRLALLCGVVALVAVPGGLAASQRFGGWLTYGGDESRVGYTAPAAGSGTVAPGLTPPAAKV